MTLRDLQQWHHTNGGVIRPTGDGTGGDLSHIWLLPAEEQVDELPADMVAAARASDARQSM